jgi:hypothetical protein
MKPGLNKKRQFAWIGSRIDIRTDLLSLLPFKYNNKYMKKVRFNKSLTV